MRLVVAGTRFRNTDAALTGRLRTAIDSGIRALQWELGSTVTEIVSGTAIGIDRMGEEWAIKNDVPVHRMPADWDHLGKRAGYVRNARMAEYADALLAIWDGESNGTRMMIAEMRRLQKPTRIELIVDSAIVE